MKPNVMPRITKSCVDAQTEIARRVPCIQYAASFMELLGQENPELVEWIFEVIHEVADSADLPPRVFVQMRDLLVAHYGMLYGAIKAQIEGDLLNRIYGTNDQVEGLEDEASDDWTKRSRADEDLASDEEV